MRRSRIVGFLALLAGTASGCATATQRGDGLASIRARPESKAPAQRLVAETSTTPASHSDPTQSDDHKGIFARPEGLSRFFPGLQKDAAEPTRVAKAGARSTWLGRRLRGIGQGGSMPTSLTYSTAPRSGSSSLRKEPGETSVLPVSLTLPSDDERDRDREVTPTSADMPDSRPGAEDKATAPGEDGKAEPRPTPREASPSEPPAAPTETTPSAGDTPRAEGSTAPTPEVSAPAPSAEPAATEPSTSLDEAKPSPPAAAAEPTPELEAPAPRAKGTDPRERPRLAAPSPRAKIVAEPAEKSKTTPAKPKSPATTRATRPKPTPGAAKDGAAKDGAASRTAAIAPPTATAAKPKPKAEDPAVLAARAHAATAHALGLPDPTLPSTYYRHDASPVRGDAAVIPTTATAPGVARPQGQCPHCGHDPNWRPSLQRLGRRLLGVGEFAPPYP